MTRNAERISYARGEPTELDTAGLHSLAHLLERSAERYSARAAFSNLGRVLSYAELEQLSRSFGVFLQRDLGLGKGERVAVMLPNLLQYPVAVFGVLRAGLTVVNVNPLYTAPELQHQLVDSGATAIVVLENVAHVLASVLPATRVRTVITTAVGDLLGFPKSWLVNLGVRHVKRMVPRFCIPGAVSFPHALAAGRGGRLREPGPEGGDIAFLQYTGGTTGLAKGAMLTHANLLANKAQAYYRVAHLLRSEREIIVTALPLYHIFALTANCLLFIHLGGLNYLITDPRDLRGFVRALKGVRFTCITGVNTLFNGLLNTPGFAELDFSGLEISLGGGMAVQRAVAERWKAVTGSNLMEAYGLTETSPAACINVDPSPAHAGSIGPPVAATECSIRDGDGDLVLLGEVGELCIRGPQVMKGYWNRPEETAQVMREGWLRTGDMAVMDEQGYLRIVDRRKDVIMVSGFNVYPNEVEEVLVAHPGVHEAGVVGMPDEAAGDSVTAVVVLSDSNLSADELRAWCRKSLTGYKVPRRIVVAKELPKSNVGKILRRQLREELLRRSQSRALSPDIK